MFHVGPLNVWYQACLTLESDSFIASSLNTEQVLTLMSMISASSSYWFSLLLFEFNWSCLFCKILLSLFQSTSVSLSAPPTPSCLPSPVSPSPPASPWPPGGTPPDPPPPPWSTPPGPSRTLTPLPSSSEPELPPSESLDLELVLDPCSDLWSLDTPGTPLWSSSFSPTLFWVSLWLNFLQRI